MHYIQGFGRHTNFIMFLLLDHKFEHIYLDTCSGKFYLQKLESGPDEVINHLDPRADPVARPAVDEAVQGGLHVPPPLLKVEENRGFAGP